MNKIIQVIFLSAIFLPTNAEVLTISEESLVKWSRENSYSSKKIQLKKLATQADLQSFNDKFSLNSETSASRAITKEEPFSSFAPITSPINIFETKITKPTKYGIAAGLFAKTNQVTNSYYSNGTTTSVGASLSIDLYKDILGRTTRAQVNSLTLKSKIAAKEAKIMQHSFTQDVRKLYWSLVANNESLSIAKGLLKTAKKLEKDTYKRFKANIADKADLARTRSQVESRKGHIYVLEFERNSLIQKLKELFPQKLGVKEIELAPYNLDQTVDKVTACTLIINSKINIPKEFTLYDDILSLLEEDLDQSNKVNNSYAKADVKFVSEFAYLGKDFGYPESFQDLKDSDQRAKSYSFGIQFIIPLDGKKKDTQETLNQINQKQVMSKYQEIEGKLNAFHSQTVKSILVLNKVIQAQKRNSKHLDETLRLANKKFKQARISARDLVIDEDSLLQSNLNEISTKLNVINTIIDYFSVYSDTPCKLNI